MDTSNDDAERSLREAAEELAEEGGASGQFMLACYFREGRGGLERDLEQAAHWYRKAAEQGHVNAQAMLGQMTYLGEGVPASSAKAIRWYRKAARQGDAGSQFILGTAYLKGDGVKPNFLEAYRWFRKAAAQGHAEAAEILDP